MTRDLKITAILLAMAASGVSFTWGASRTTASPNALAAAGERLLADNCERCHAIHRTGDSKSPSAPPFRTLSRKYPLEQLEEALAEGITTGHPEMPEFVFSPDEIAAILAYIESISEPAARR